MAAPLRAFAGIQHEAYSLNGSVGAAALLVHGFPGTPVELRTVGEMLHRAGLSVEGMLLPGFGADFIQVADYHNEEWLAAILTALDALYSRFGRVLLVGNSMGAALAIQAAAQRPVDGLLLFAPWWHIKQRWLNAAFPYLQPLVPNLQPFRRANFADARVRAHILRFVPDANLDDPAVQQAVRALTFRTSVIGEVRRAGLLAGAAAPAVDAPTLIVQGARDVLVRPTVTATLARRLPNVVGVVIANADHEFAHMQNAKATSIEPLIAHFAQAVAAGAYDRVLETTAGPAKVT